MLPILLEALQSQKNSFVIIHFEAGGYLKIFEIQHNETLLYLYFTYKIL